MTTKEMLVEISGKTGFSQKDIKTVIDAMGDVIIDCVKNCDEVKVMNGLTFCGVMKDAHEGRNPSTGDKIQIPAKVQFKTKVGLRIKNAIN